MKKSKNLIYKILKRSFLLFFFGLVTSNSDYSLDEIRIMGVLQVYIFIIYDDILYSKYRKALSETKLIEMKRLKTSMVVSI
jgi:hypothetical protein